MMDTTGTFKALTASILAPMRCAEKEAMTEYMDWAGDALRHLLKPDYHGCVALRTGTRLPAAQVPSLQMPEQVAVHQGAQ